MVPARLALGAGALSTPEIRTVLLLAAVLLPLLMTAACAGYVRRRRRVGAALGDRRLVQQITGRDLHAVPWGRLATMLLAAAALGAALLEARRDADSPSPAGGRDVVLVLDASNSMRVRDVEPDRLERQRLLARSIVRALPDDRIGVVVFAGEASVLTPPTRDHGAVEMYIDAVAPAVAVQGGSAIGAGLRQAASLLAGGERRGAAPVVVLLSDGESPDPAAERDAARVAARRAADLGITVHTLGIGTERGGPVPDLDPATGRAVGYKQDPLTGETAHSALDTEMLRRVAREGGGAHHDLRDAGALDTLLDRLRAGAPAESGTSGSGGPAPRYGWFVALALALIAADAARERRRA